MTDYFLGKKRWGKKIAHCIAGLAQGAASAFDSYHDPFFGMGHVAYHLLPLLPENARVFASDVNGPLMHFWQAVLSGALRLPDSFTHEQLLALRNTREQATPLHVLAGYACSYMGRYFDGIRPERYARNRDSLLRVAQGFLAHPAPVHLQEADFFDLPTPRHAIVYLDPPYGTATNWTLSRFGHCDQFDMQRFWQRACEWAQPKHGNLVCVSEREAPDDWQCVWEQAYNIQQNGWVNRGVTTRYERLFCYTPALSALGVH